MNKSELDKIATKIVNAAFEVHKELGAGLLESVYHVCLVKELKNRGLKVESEVRIPLVYKVETLTKEFYIDLLVEDEIIVELKAIEIMLPVHEAQLISYLKLADKRLGFLINFNVDLIKNGIKRRINGYLK